MDMKSIAVLAGAFVALSSSGTAILGGVSIEDIEKMDIDKITHSMGTGGKKIVDTFAQVMDKLADEMQKTLKK